MLVEDVLNSGIEREDACTKAFGQGLNFAEVFSSCGAIRRFVALMIASCMLQCPSALREVSAPKPVLSIGILLNGVT